MKTGIVRSASILFLDGLLDDSLDFLLDHLSTFV